MNKERVFIGTKMQRGYGLGGFFASLFRRALPLFKSGGKYLVKKAAKMGANTIQDIARGHEPRQAFKRHVADTSDEILDEIRKKIKKKMTGNGPKKKQTLKKKIMKKKNTMKKKNIKDIFKC